MYDIHILDYELLQFCGNFFCSYQLTWDFELEL